MVSLGGASLRSSAMRRAPADHDFHGWVAQLGVSGCRQRAKHHLLQSGPASLAALRVGLQHPKPIVRRLCAGILDHLVDDASIPDLVAALDDPDPSVSARALHALACDQCKEGECRPDDELFVPRALDLLADRNPDLRAAAIDALGRIARRRPDVAAALMEVSETDSDGRLREMARRRARTRVSPPG